jgi:hypothetical protein
MHVAQSFKKTVSVLTYVRQIDVAESNRESVPTFSRAKWTAQSRWYGNGGAFEATVGR